MRPEYRAIVLHSGGIDSTSCLSLAESLYGPNYVLSVGLDYGQKHRIELECADSICEYLGIQRHIITLPPIANSALTEADQDVPDKKYSEIEGVSPAYVPFRNGYFLSAAASLAQSLGAERIYIGAHAEDAERDAYPDCTLEFVGAMASAIYVGTYHKVRLVAPFLAAEKSEVVSTGSRLGAPLHLTWSCYRGGKYHCGHCMTCYARKEAFSKAGIADPTVYLSDETKAQA